MNRIDAFKKLEGHAWLGKVFAKLSKQEKELAMDFLAKNSALSNGDFQLAVNRMFLDAPKPKNHTSVMELLSCANSSSGK